MAFFLGKTSCVPAWILLNSLTRLQRSILMGSRVIYLFQTILFSQSVWKIKRYLRQDNVRVGLQREELTVCVRLLPSLFLLLYDCGSASHSCAPGRKHLIFPVHFVFFSGSVLGSHWRARCAMDFIGRTKVFYKQQLSCALPSGNPFGST